MAFTNFELRSSSLSLFSRFQCALVSKSEAQVVFTFCTTMTTVKEFFSEEKVNVFFVSSELMETAEFQSFISARKEPPLVWPIDQWETQLGSNLPFLLSYLGTKTAKEKLEQEWTALSQQVEKLAIQFNEDIELATKIHHQLIPTSNPKIPGVVITSKYLPASGLGGDYFDVFELNDKKHLGILMADSQTHGMASALLSSLLKVRLDDFKDRESFSQNLMNHLNQELYSIHQSKLPGLDLVVGLLDRTTLIFEYVSAGSLKPLLWNYPRFLELPISTNPALGLFPSHQYSKMTHQLRPGDLLFFYTNGLEAVFGQRGIPLSHELANLFKATKKMDPLDFQTEVLAQINRFQEEQAELPDDITVIQLMIDKKALYLTQSK